MVEECWIGQGLNGTINEKAIKWSNSTSRESDVRKGLMAKSMVWCKTAPLVAAVAVFADHRGASWVPAARFKISETNPKAQAIGKCVADVSLPISLVFWWWNTERTILSSYSLVGPFDVSTARFVERETVGQWFLLAQCSKLQFWLWLKDKRVLLRHWSFFYS